MTNSINIVNIEKVVLSSIFFNPQELEDIVEVLKPKDFYFIPHSQVYEAMLNLYSQDLPIDEDIIRAKGINDNVLLDILSANPITNVKAYVRQIKDSAVKRELANLSLTIAKLIKENISSKEIITIIENEFYKITDTLNTYKSKSLFSIIESFKKRFEKASGLDGQNRFIKTGIFNFDRNFTGFEPSNYIIIGARPSMGKSALAFQIALHNIKNNKGVIIDSLEMSSEDVILRMIAQKNKENISDLLKGFAKDKDKFNQTLDYLNNNKFLHIDDKVLTFNALKSKFLKIKRDRDKQGLKTDVWIIDHIGYVKTSYKLKRHEELSLGSKMLKELSKELNITIIALSQLNRNLTNRTGKNKYRPSLSDLKDSGSLEEDADMVILLHRDSYYLKAEKNELEDDINQADILVLKNRNGKSGVIICDFKASINSFGTYPVVEYKQANSCLDDQEEISKTELTGLSNIIM